MITIGIAGILMAIAIPSFNTFTRNARITGPSNEILTALYLARNEAIKRRLTTVFCFSTAPSAALPDCAGTGASGWIVFVDTANAAVPSANDLNGKADAGEPILLRHAAIANGVTARTLPAVNGHYVSFAASGLGRTNPTGVPVTGVVICDSRGNTVITPPSDSAARGVIVSPIGRSRVTRLAAEITAPLGGCP